MPRLTVLCRLIGSGKTTYALKNYKNVTDLDFLPSSCTKKHQINQTKRHLNLGYDVCHITCFPTEEEFTAFQNLDAEYLSLDTSINQCKTNILIRNRERDMKDLGNVLAANRKYAEKISKSHFERVTVFRGKSHDSLL